MKYMPTSVSLGLTKMFEEKMTGKLDKQLKGIVILVKPQIQELRELQGMQQDMEANRHGLQAAHRQQQMWPAVVEI
jgi:hypothetical protein